MANTRSNGYLRSFAIEMKKKTHSTPPFPAFLAINSSIG